MTTRSPARDAGSRRVLTAAVAVLGLAAPALLACGGGQGDGEWRTVTDTTAGGAMLVRHTPPPDAAPTWRLEPEVRIGAVDGDGPDVFGQVVALAVHPDGRIAVLDAQAQEIRIFAPDGHHLATYGGKGQGPGEFQRANGLVVGPDGVLRVPDTSNNRLSFVDFDRGYLRSHPYQPLMYGYTWDGLVDSAGRSWSEHYVVSTVPGEQGRRVIVGYEPDGTVVDSIARPRDDSGAGADHPGAWTIRRGGRMMASLTVPGYPWERSILTPDLHLWSTPAGDPAYRLSRWNPATGDTLLVMEVDRPLQPNDMARADSIARDYEEEFDATLDRSKIPTYQPAVSGLFTDADGRLWVRAATAGDSLRAFDVYDARDGAYIGTLATDIPVQMYPPPFIRGEHVWALVRDEMDVPFVVRARMVEAQGRR